MCLSVPPCCPVRSPYDAHSMPHISATLLPSLIPNDAPQRASLLSPGPRLSLGFTDFMPSAHRQPSCCSTLLAFSCMRQTRHRRKRVSRSHPDCRLPGRSDHPGKCTCLQNRQHWWMSCTRLWAGLWVVLAEVVRASAAAMRRCSSRGSSSVTPFGRMCRP